jgi:hypothetical protein
MAIAKPSGVKTTRTILQVTANVKTAGSVAIVAISHDPILLTGLDGVAIVIVKCQSVPGPGTQKA